MSIEVAAHKYLFLPSNSQDSCAEEFEVLVKESITIMQRGKVPWVYNHLHNLELLWWVVVWIMFYNHFQDSDK